MYDVWPWWGVRTFGCMCECVRFTSIHFRLYVDLLNLFLDDKLRGFLSGLTQPSSLFPREVSNPATANAAPSLRHENKEDKKAVDSDDEEDPEEEMYVGALSEMVGVVFAQVCMYLDALFTSCPHPHAKTFCLVVNEPIIIVVLLVRCILWRCPA